MDVVDAHGIAAMHRNATRAGALQGAMEGMGVGAMAAAAATMSTRKTSRRRRVPDPVAGGRMPHPRPGLVGFGHGVGGVAEAGRCHSGTPVRWRGMDPGIVLCRRLAGLLALVASLAGGRKPLNAPRGTTPSDGRRRKYDSPRNEIL